MMDLADFTAVSKIAPQEKRPEPQPPQPATGTPEAAAPREIGGRDGPEPTRFGDWEKAGRCIDF
jgi:hypothetical protein